MLPVLCIIIALIIQGWEVRLIFLPSHQALKVTKGQEELKVQGELKEIRVQREVETKELKELPQQVIKGLKAFKVNQVVKPQQELKEIKETQVLKVIKETKVTRVLKVTKGRQVLKAIRVTMVILEVSHSLTPLILLLAMLILAQEN